MDSSAGVCQRDRAPVLTEKCDIVCKKKGWDLRLSKHELAKTYWKEGTMMLGTKSAYKKVGVV